MKRLSALGAFAQTLPRFGVFAQRLSVHSGLMGPFQQGSKEVRSMPELKDRLEGLLEALFMRILDSPSHATFGALGAFAMRSMRAWAGFRYR